MACLEPCECGGDPKCTECGGKGAIVIDTDLWALKRGYPTAMKRSVPSHKNEAPVSIFKAIKDFFTKW